MPDVPPLYLRFMRPKRSPLFDLMNQEDISPGTMIDLETVRLGRHRLFGFSVDCAYWPDSWQDEWAIDELREWEWPGWKNDPSRKDQYYADFIVDENQQARENERRQIESKPVSPGQRPVVLVVHESVRERDMDRRTDVPSGIESKNVLRLERGVSGRYAADLSGEDD